MKYLSTRLTRLIIDYLNRNGFLEIAKQMIKDYNLEEFSIIELELIIDSIKIIKSL